MSNEETILNGGRFNPKEHKSSVELLGEIKEEIKPLEGVVQHPAQKQQLFRTLAAATDFISGFQIYPVHLDWNGVSFVVTYNNSEV